MRNARLLPVDIEGSVGLSPFGQFKAHLSVLKPKGGSQQIFFKFGHDKFVTGNFDETGLFPIYETIGAGESRRRGRLLGPAFSVLDHLSRENDGGVFVIPTQPIGQPLAKCVDSTDVIVAEIDSLDEQGQDQRHQEFSADTGLLFTVKLTSGGKSRHVWIKLDKHYPVEQAQYLRFLVCLLLRSDPVTTRLHQPVRFAGFYRKEKNALQQLLELNPVDYSYEQVVEGCRKGFAALGWRFPEQITQEWFSKRFFPILKGCAKNSEEFKVEAIRAELELGLDSWIAQLEAKKTEQAERFRQRQLKVAQLQLEGKQNLVEMVGAVEDRLGADGFDNPSHNWKFSNSEHARGNCPWHDSKSGASAWISGKNGRWTFHCTQCNNDAPISHFVYWHYQRRGWGAAYPSGKDYAETAIAYLREYGVEVPEFKPQPKSKDRTVTRKLWLVKGFGKPKSNELTPVEERQRLINKRKLTFRTRYWDVLKTDFTLSKADVEYEGFCPDIDLGLSRTFLIQGWLGAGKTEAIIRSLAKANPGKLVIGTTTRNGLLYQFGARCDKAGFVHVYHYQADVSGNRLLLDTGSESLITMAVPSFKDYAVGRVNWEDTILVIDEFRSVRCEVLNNPEAFPEFERALREAGTLIVADAFLSDVDRAILKRYRGRNRIIYRQKFSQSPKRIKWAEVTTKDGKIGLALEGAYLDLLDEMIAAGGRHPIACDNCLTAQTITRHLTLKGKKVKLVCSLTPETNGPFLADPDSVIEDENPDFVVYTPTAQAGLDIQKPFDSGLLIATGVLSPLDMLQMLGRARQCQSWTVLAPRFTSQDALYTNLDGKRVAAWGEQLGAEFERLELQTSPNTKAWSMWQSVTRDIEKTFNSEYLQCLLEYFFESVETVTVPAGRVSEWRELQSEQKSENTVKKLTGDVENGQRLISQQKAPKTNQEVWDIEAAKLATRHGGTMARLKAEYDKLAAAPETSEEQLKEVIDAAKIIAGNKTEKLKAYLTVNDDDICKKYLKRLQGKRFISFCSPQWKRYTMMRLFRELRLERLAAASRDGKIVAGENAYTKDSPIVAELYSSFRANRDLAALFPFVENQYQFWQVCCRCMCVFGFQSCGKKIRVENGKQNPNGRNRDGSQRYSTSAPVHHSAWYQVEESGSKLMRELLPGLLAEVQQVIEQEEAARDVWDEKQKRERQEAKRWSGAA